MDITMIGLQNAGKTSLLRVLAVSVPIDEWDVPGDLSLNRGRSGWRVHYRVCQQHGQVQKILRHMLTGGG